MKVFILCLILHLIFGILGTRLLIKKYKQNDWNFDNYDFIFITCCFLLGLIGYISVLITKDDDDCDWKITKWFNKKLK